MTVEIRVKKPASHALKIAVATIVLFACIALLTRFIGRHGNSDGPVQNGWQVYFSPGGGCTEAIAQQIGQAKDSVFVQAYSFTSKPIAKALADAKKRGVAISVILDKSQRTEQYSEADFLAHAGVRTLIDDAHALNHNKAMVIDGQTVITGSFNFTAAAEEKNAENLLVIQDKSLAQRYTENWYTHAAHSQQYNGK
jgi:phosphatidylserine/phosphatidylglycerophosphate/cardiolipin synthase-like enzyme